MEFHDFIPGLGVDSPQGLVAYRWQILFRVSSLVSTSELQDTNHKPYAPWKAADIEEDYGWKVPLAQGCHAFRFSFVRRLWFDLRPARSVGRNRKKRTGCNETGRNQMNDNTVVRLSMSIHTHSYLRGFRAFWPSLSELAKSIQLLVDPKIMRWKDPVRPRIRSCSVSGEEGGFSC